MDLSSLCKTVILHFRQIFCVMKCFNKILFTDLTMAQVAPLSMAPKAPLPPSTAHAWFSYLREVILRLFNPFEIFHITLSQQWADFYSAAKAKAALTGCKDFRYAGS